jgi:hypothetical protein
LFFGLAGSMSPLGNGTGGRKTNSAAATCGSAFESANGPIRPVRKWRSAMRSGSCGRHTFAHCAIAHAASLGASPAFVAPGGSGGGSAQASRTVRLISGAGPLSATIEDTRHRASEADVNKRVGFEHHPSAKRWSRGIRRTSANNVHAVKWDRDLFCIGTADGTAHVLTPLVRFFGRTWSCRPRHDP